MVADYLDEMRTDIQTLRVLCVTGAAHEETGQKARIMLKLMPPKKDEEQHAQEKTRRFHLGQSRGLTPLVKYFGGEKAVEIARGCIQIVLQDGARCLSDASSGPSRDAVACPMKSRTSAEEFLPIRLAKTAYPNRTAQGCLAEQFQEE